MQFPWRKCHASKRPTGWGKHPIAVPSNQAYFELVAQISQPPKNRNKMKIYLPVVLSLLIAGCGALASMSLTQANLDKIHNDMSPAEVKAILGDPADSKTEPIPIVGGTQTTYTYHSGSSDVTIVFKNDLMKEKNGTFSQ